LVCVLQLKIQITLLAYCYLCWIPLVGLLMYTA